MQEIKKEVVKNKHYWKKKERKNIERKNIERKKEERMKLNEKQTHPVRIIYEKNFKKRKKLKRKIEGKIIR